MLAAMHPLERLLNLVALLLETKRPLTFDEIRSALGAYAQQDRGTAKRQFERDKDVLRSLGIPVDVAATDLWEVEEGYHIPRERYELPDISFTPEEAAALFVAAHGEDREASQAFRKLLPNAGGGALSAIEGEPFAAVDASAPHLQPIAEAVAGRRRISFRYRSAQGDEADREVDPWGLLFRRGAWYLVGQDRGRGEARSFRLSRITSGVRDAGEGERPPDGFSAAEHLAAGPWGLGEPDTVARVAFSPRVAWWALAAVPGAANEVTRDDGWTEADVPASAGDGFVSWILSLGPDAEILAPDAVRAQVVDTLERVRASL